VVKAQRPNVNITYDSSYNKAVNPILIEHVYWKLYPRTLGYTKPCLPPLPSDPDEIKGTV